MSPQYGPPTGHAQEGDQSPQAGQSLGTTTSRQKRHERRKRGKQAATPADTAATSPERAMEAPFAPTGLETVQNLIVPHPMGRDPAASSRPPKEPPSVGRAMNLVTFGALAVS